MLPSLMLKKVERVLNSSLHVKEKEQGVPIDRMLGHGLEEHRGVTNNWARSGEGSELHPAGRGQLALPCRFQGTAGQDVRCTILRVLLKEVVRMLISNLQARTEGIN